MTPHFVTEHCEQMARLMADRELPGWRKLDLAIGGNVMRNALASGKRIMDAVDLSQSTRLLDFGCGYGNLLHALPQDHLHYTGVDVVVDLLNAGSITCWGCPTEWILIDSYKLPFADDHFDVACAFSVFSHLYLHEAFLYLEELHRVLKPGGKLIFTFWEGNTEGWRQFWKTIEHHRIGVVAPPNTMMSVFHVEVLGKAAGFQPPQFIPSTSDDYGPFNQTTAILEKPL